MMQRDDFENRLGKGLKRWAQAGEPTLDLEALVKQRMGESPEAPSETTPAAVPPLARPQKRRWTRWLSGMAAAAALVLAVGATFPTWAGAAAEWPLVGPVVKEIILQDAGLKWAYDQGFIQGTMAEVTQGDVTVRILGVVADRARTTIIYQITGWSRPEMEAGRPVQAGKWPFLTRPVDHGPSVFIAKVNGVGVGSWSSGPVETPMGIFGTAGTKPLNQDQAPIEVMVMIGGERTMLNLDVKRTAEASREVPVNLSQAIGGINIHVDAVIYTPAETMIRYKEEKEPFFGTVNLQDVGGLPYLEVDGKRIKTNSTYSFGGETYVIFPEPVEGNARFVIPGLHKAAVVDAQFPLKSGAVQEIQGAPVTLTEINRSGRLIRMEWKWPVSTDLMGLGDMQLVDAAGRSVKFETNGEGIWQDENQEGRSKEGELPEGFEPVAVRITQAAVAVRGPWVFQLPR